jgi:integrase
MRSVVIGTKAGAAVPVWLDQSGSIVTAPRSKSDSAALGGTLSLFTVLGSWLLLWGLFRLARIPLDRRRFREWATAYETSRVDVAGETAKNIGSHLKRILPFFGDRDPAAITSADVMEWVGANVELAPSSLSRYLATLRLILDFADVEPNPARDRRVKLPSIVSEEPKPPTAKHVLAIIEHVPTHWRLPLVVLEQTGMRVGEAHTLAWGDVDIDGCQFRLSKATTKTRRSRWVQVPEWLMAEVDATCPPDDRTSERRVFTGFTPDVAKNVIARACTAAGIPHYHPHDLRHRRLSLWHGQGVPAKELAERAGHARASMSLDVYSHVMPLEEVAWERPGVVSVWSQEGAR